ncbi:MAG TPA: arginase family protein [bacterium]|nr:arginase family protein [bacterium]
MTPVRLGTTLLVPFRVGALMPDLCVAGDPEVLRPVLPEGTPQERLGALCGAVAERIAAGGVGVAYVGDCVLTLGVLAGLERRGVAPRVIWLDAHGDFHTWETTRSGHLVGMPLAMAVGRGEQTIVRAAGLTPVAEERVLLVDARDLDPGEDDAVAASRMRRVTVDQLRRAPVPDGPLYVHLDIDVVNPVEIPAVNYPAPGGPSAEQVRDALAHVAETGRVAALSVTLWEPRLPGASQSAAAVARLVEPFLATSPPSPDARRAPP